MCVKRHSAIPLRRIPPIRIVFAAGDKMLDQDEAALSVREVHAANENSSPIKQEGLWRRRHLLFRQVLLNVYQSARTPH